MVDWCWCFLVSNYFFFFFGTNFVFLSEIIFVGSDDECIWIIIRVHCNSKKHNCRKVSLEFGIPPGFSFSLISKLLKRSVFFFGVFVKFPSFELMVD